MCTRKCASHFKGKSVPQHLKEAREKGMAATAEVHGTEMPGSRAAFVDAVRESSVLFALISMLAPPSDLLFVAIGWLIWKTGRCALLGWSRLERLHRLIEEERHEIEHHRDEERQELTEIYAAKGFSGELLEQVIDVLMADDNRLLQIMLEEELGLSLESHEHPLKQAAGAALGVILSIVLLYSGFLVERRFGIFGAALLLFLLASHIGAKLEKNRPLNTMVWSSATGALAVGAAYIIHQWIYG